MGYSRNGQDFVNSLCETGYGNTTNDKRARADINSARFWFGGANRATNYPDAQFITYPEGYSYAHEALGGKYGGWPTFQRKEFQVSAKGWRPYSKHRYSQNTAGSLFIKKTSDGAVILADSSNTMTGTVIIPASCNAQEVFICMAGAGGGGGGSTAVASAGGGGAGGYFFGYVQIAEYIVAYIGGGGAGGGGKANGSAGEDSTFYYYENFVAYRNGATPRDFVRTYGGGGGYGGGNNSGGGGSSQYPLGPNTSRFMHPCKIKQGGSGGQRNNAGGTSTVNFTNLTPEAETITYFTGGGGSSGGSSGGGGGGANPLGQGGSGGNKGGGGAGSIGSGGGGGGYKAFTTQSGGSGGNGYLNIMY